MYKNNYNKNYKKINNNNNNKNKCKQNNRNNKNMYNLIYLKDL